MIKFFRKIRQKMLAEKRFSKYLLYAIGEIILVVIGILIALQINNWNQNKSDQSALSGYLTSISNNIKEDIEKIDFIKEKRVNTVTRIPYMFENIAQLDFLEKIDIKFAAETINTISKLEYLNSDASGFESIKNSGFLSKLQGRDIENLIYKYYNLIQETARKEKDYNETLKNAVNDFNSQGFEKKDYLNYPDYIADKEELTMLQPYLKKILFHSSSIMLYTETNRKVPELIVSYENLSIIGKEITRMIDNNLRTFDSNSSENLGHVFNINSKTGYSKLFHKGTMYNGFYEVGMASENNEFIKYRNNINDTKFSFPKAKWSVLYIRPPSNVHAEKPTKDYSSYKSIKLELKSDVEGATVMIALKDTDDPDDGSETKIPIVLSNHWKTYEIQLSEFKTANLNELFVVVSFIFYDQALNMNIKNIEYLK